jgi:hypothetical protein
MTETLQNWIEDVTLGALRKSLLRLRLLTVASGMQSIVITFVAYDGLNPDELNPNTWVLWCIAAGCSIAATILVGGLTQSHSHTLRMILEMRTRSK